MRSFVQIYLWELRSSLSCLRAYRWIRQSL